MHELKSRKKTAPSGRTHWSCFHFGTLSSSGQLLCKQESLTSLLESALHVGRGADAATEEVCGIATEATARCSVRPESSGGASRAEAAGAAGRGFSSAGRPPRPAATQLYPRAGGRSLEPSPAAERALADALRRARRPSVPRGPGAQDGAKLCAGGSWASRGSADAGSGAGGPRARARAVRRRGRFPAAPRA